MAEEKQKRGVYFFLGILLLVTAAVVYYLVFGMDRGNDAPEAVSEAASAPS